MNKLHSVIAEVFDVPPDSVTETSNPETMPQWDSLGHINLVAAIEAAFEVHFTLDEIPEMTSVAAIQEILKRKQ